MTPTLVYEHTDIPPGMTCAEYRRAHAPARSRSRRLLGQAALVLLYPARLIAYAGDEPCAQVRPAAIYFSDADAGSPNLAHGQGSALP
jgi:hypothetical protein